MNILQVVPDISLEANGVTPVIEALARDLQALGNQVGLATIAARGPLPGVDMITGRKWPFPARFEVSTELARKLARSAGRYDIVHNHSLWSMINVAAGFIVPGKRAKLVTSPHGTLAPVSLRRARALKAVLWPFQRRALARADLLHATSEAEVQDIRRLGFRAPIALIPNGVAMPAAVAARTGERHTLLFLSRIHPQRGLENLLAAWRALEPDFPQWRLVIAGVGEDAYVASVAALVRQLGLRRVELSGPRYGDEKKAAYDGADLFVLPSNSENFGMVVAEALAHGCPVVVGTGAPWSGVLSHDCGWWVGNDAPTLGAALREAMGGGRARLREMGQNGRRWVESDFQWPAIAARFDGAYRWIAGAGEMPDCIRTLP